MTTREIGKIVEQLCGHYYSPQTISVITKQLDEKVKEYHSRKITKEYAVVYADSTYISVKRGTVGKEALHILIGITISSEISSMLDACNKKCFIKSRIKR